MKHCLWFALLGSFFVPPAGASAQAGSFFSDWNARVLSTTAKQPAWAVPVVTIPSILTQLVRMDFTREINSDGSTTWDIGDHKGVFFIPWYKTEFDVQVPPYIHHAPTGDDGFGDMQLELKYRVAAGNATHGNYSVLVALIGAIPTGSYKNGSPNASLGPALNVGKGFGKVDVQTQVAGTLPVGDGLKLGRPITWNTVAQYHVYKVLWPEIEANVTYNHGGPNDGKNQTFLLPGMVIDEFKLSHDPRNRLGILIGAGIQIATSHYHSYNHGVVLSGRLNF